MFNILIRVSKPNIAGREKIGFSLRALRKNNLGYTFSTSQQQPHMNKEGINEERIKKQQEIQFRKKSMEELEIKKIRQRVQNTQGKYNPTLAYLKLYSNHFQIIIFLGAICFILTIFMTVGGAYKDELTNKKKLIVVSQKFQKSIDGILRKMIITQLCGSFSINQVNSSSLKRKFEQMQSFIQQKTKRKYKVVVLPTQQHIVSILPSSIVISKNMFNSNEFKKEDLQNLVIIMQRLFNKKLHIKQLALSNALLYFMVRIKQNTNSQVKLSSIYSRRYAKSEVDLAINQISSLYGTSQEQLKQSLSKVLTKLGQQIYRQQSKFSLLNRFAALIEPQ